MAVPDSHRLKLNLQAVFAEELGPYRLAQARPWMSLPPLSEAIRPLVLTGRASGVTVAEVTVCAGIPVCVCLSYLK